MAYGARLESGLGVKALRGSNPLSSASARPPLTWAATAQVEVVGGPPPRSDPRGDVVGCSVVHVTLNLSVNRGLEVRRRRATTAKFESLSSAT